jgi:hypothetical protein
MKVGTDGQWTGLAYCEKVCPYVDYFSSPDGWRFGFDIVYRLIFSTEDRDVIDMFRAAFMAAFGLSKEHYSITDIPKPGSSVFWRAYWDRNGFDLKFLSECDKRLDRVGEKCGQRVLVLEVAIIPRSKKHIKELMDSNKVT